MDKYSSLLFSQPLTCLEWKEKLIWYITLRLDIFTWKITILFSVSIKIIAFVALYSTSVERI